MGDELYPYINKWTLQLFQWSNSVTVNINCEDIDSFVWLLVDNVWRYVQIKQHIDWGMQSIFTWEAIALESQSWTKICSPEVGLEPTRTYVQWKLSPSP